MALNIWDLVRDEVSSQINTGLSHDEIVAHAIYRISQRFPWIPHDVIRHAIDWSKI